MTSATDPIGPATLEAARRTVGLIFIVNGLSLATWMSRLPEMRDRLELSPGQVGLLLLCLSAGTLLALPSSGLIVGRLGSARTVAAGATTVTLGLLVMGFGLAEATVPAVGLGMFAYGVGVSTWDVAMNLEAADVERRLGRSIMPRFHAGFSVGTVLGAGIGALSSHFELSLALQLVVTAAVLLPLALFSIRAFLPLEPPHEESHGSPWRAWREPRTLAIGLVVLTFALCEGIANDWLALSLVDGYDVVPAAGAAAYAAFVTAMTLGRFVGGSAMTRFGRVRVLRGCAVLVIAGVGLVITSPIVLGAYVGALLWGLGASLGFPAGMTAAGEDPRHAAVRVSVVSSIGYAAFLGGPPLVGAIAEQVGVLNSLIVAVVAAVVAFVAAVALTPRPKALADH